MPAFMPLAAAWVLALVLALLDGRRRWVGWVAVGGLAATLALIVTLMVRAVTGSPAEQVLGGWPAGVGIRIRADALGTVFAAVSIASLLAALAHEVVRGVEERTFPAVVAFLASGLTGLFLTADAFNFYVFFELSMAASFTVAFYGREKRQIRGALLFTVINLLGSVLFLIAVVSLYHVAGTLDLRILAAVRLTPGAGMVIATLVLVALGVKLGLFPFHTWLPPVYRAARPAVAAMLSGAVVNIGAYGLLRFGGEIFTRELHRAAPFLVILGAASILYGAVIAVRQRPAPDVLAYSSISQSGYVILALAIGTGVGYAAAVVYAVANSLNKTVLFLTSGMRNAVASVAFAVGALSVAGIPPSAGFFGKAAVFRAGVVAADMVLVVLVVLGSGLSFLYMFGAYQRGFWANGPPERVTRATGRWVPMAAVAAVIVGLGLWPEGLLRAAGAAADVLGGGG